MNRVRVIAFIAVVGLLFAGLYVLIPRLTTPQPTLPLATVTITTPSGPVQVSAEIADEPDEWSRGLMLRPSLAEGAGMLFVFHDERVRSFWMKDTLIPLDVLFMNEALTVVHIVGAVPCEADPCPRFSSNLPARYALEVNAGFVQVHDIRVGAEVTIET